MPNDAALLRQYAGNKVDAAFTEFVRRNVDLVYASALRRVGGDAHLAEDVTQHVFVAASRAAARLSRHPRIAAWLFATTRNTAVQAVRAERRRREREKTSQIMNDVLQDPPLEWDRLRPVLDEAIDRLSEADRQIVILRFFAGLPYADIGAHLCVAENAARMRVERALERLNGYLTRNGITSTSAALSTVLLANGVTAAPSGLTTSVAVAALAPHGAAAAGGTLTWVMGITKLQAVSVGALMLAGTMGWVVERTRIAGVRNDIARLQEQGRDAGAVVARHVQLDQARRVAERDAAADTATLADVRRKTATIRTQLAAIRARREAQQLTAQSRPAHIGPVYDLSVVSPAPRPVHRPVPDYPAALRVQGVTGEAVIDFVIGPDGKVTNAAVISATHPEFGEAALSGVLQWEFEPGQVNGTAVGTHLRKPIRFRLSEGGPPTGSATASEPGEYTFWF